MARGPVKTTQQKIEETERELARLKAQLEVEEIQRCCCVAIKNCLDKQKLHQVYEIFKNDPALIESGKKW